jgi:mRNA interferase MazF
MNPVRGEVWWVDLEPTRGSEINKKRPCVVLSIDTLNQRRKTVVVVPLSTSRAAHPPLTIMVNVAGREEVAVLDQIRATAKERFANRMGTLSAAEMEMLELNLREIFGLN